VALAVDFNSLSAITREIGQLGFAVKNRVAIRVKDEMNMLLVEQFDGGFDPAGEPWEPLKPSTVKRGRHAPPLTDTHRMRDHVRAVRVGTNVVIESELPAAFHQSGTSRMAARKMWPDEGEPMPERWETRVSLAANAGVLEAARVLAERSK
jgi:Phage virion morphogenesis family